MILKFETPTVRSPILIEQQDDRFGNDWRERLTVDVFPYVMATLERYEMSLTIKALMEAEGAINICGYPFPEKIPFGGKVLISPKGYNLLLKFQLEGVIKKPVDGYTLNTRLPKVDGEEIAIHYYPSDLTPGEKFGEFHIKATSRITIWQFPVEA